MRGVSLEPRAVGVAAADSGRPRVVLTGLGTAVPHNVIAQARAAKLSAELIRGQQAKAVEALYRRSGVKFRHSVLLEGNGESIHTQSFYAPARDEQDRGPSTSERMERYAVEAPVLAADACRKALYQAGARAEGVTHLVTVSCSGFAAPGCDLKLIEMLGLSPAVTRTNVGFMGCHGLMNALRVARGYVESDPSATVMISAVELCSLHQQYTQDAQQIVANALFSDGTACLILQSEASAGSGGGWSLADQRSFIIPGTAEMMSWRIGDYGFEMTLSPSVPDIIRETLRPWLSEWLDDVGLSIPDVGCWAIHPGGPRVLSATGETLGLHASDLSPSFEILEQYGNMSSPTVAFILEQLQSGGSRPPCVMIAFGPGLTIEAALWV